ncbi:MAG TPA: MOSC domain-containing protein [Candidatus Saccharimonadia bacterium]|nr:MOSC domain-containing protein [Candidatus Saccharimonadia bacterium]
MRTSIELVETRLGQPCKIGQDQRGADFWSSIDRQRVEVPELYLTWTGLAGDRATNTRLNAAAGGLDQTHGGHDKAVYAYPLKHYPAWLAELGEDGLGGRSLGENWRLRGVSEADVRIGDIWTLGEAELEVSKARQPCNGLVIYYGGQSMIKRMAANGFCGWYLKVRRPGVVPTTGTIHVVHHNLDGPTVAEAFALKMQRRTNI